MKREATLERSPFSLGNLVTEFLKSEHALTVTTNRITALCLHLWQQIKSQSISVSSPHERNRSMVISFQALHQKLLHLMQSKSNLDEDKRMRTAKGSSGALKVKK